jgi:SPP1 family predicted phage head-tail adaptor
MRAGPLRHRIDIQQLIETRRPGGSIQQDFETYLADVNAEIQWDGRWREALVAQQIQADIDCRIRIRYRPGLNEKMRVRHTVTPGSPSDYEYLDIMAIRPADGRNVELHLFCTKRGAEGFRTGAPS